MKKKIENNKVIIKNGARTRKPANKSELQCYNIMENKGYTVIKTGYPDLFCFDKNGNIILVEVKQFSADILKTNQKLMLQLFSKYGIPCYKWTPDKGFEKIK